MTCAAINKNKFTISVDGNIFKCDDDNGNIKDLTIGNINNLNKQYIDEIKHSKWLFNNLNYNHICDKCFYSCSCLMIGCPKHSIINNKNSCPLNYTELNGLLQLAVKSLNAEVIQ